MTAADTNRYHDAVVVAGTLSCCLARMWSQLDPVEQQRWRDLATADTDQGRRAALALQAMQTNMATASPIRFLDEPDPVGSDR